MIKNFIKKFEINTENSIVCFGDLNALHLQKKHMKYKEPIKGKGMRTLLNASRLQNGFQTFLVDEHRTSCRCLGCEGGVNEKFMVRPNPKPYRTNLRLVHGLLRCKNCERMRVARE